MIDYTDGSDTICYAEMVGMPEYCSNIANMKGCKSTECWQARIYYARIEERNRIVEWLRKQPKYLTRNAHETAADSIEQGKHLEDK